MGAVSISRGKRGVGKKKGDVLTRARREESR